MARAGLVLLVLPAVMAVMAEFLAVAAVMVTHPEWVATAGHVLREAMERGYLQVRAEPLLPQLHGGYAEPVELAAHTQAVGAVVAVELDYFFPWQPRGMAEMAPREQHQQPLVKSVPVAVVVIQPMAAPLPGPMVGGGYA